MKQVLVKTLFFSAVVLMASCNDGKNKTDSKEVAKEENEQKFDDKPIEDDAKFVLTAAEGGMIEVKLGELAQTNAMSASVKEFGKMMAQDHGKANGELKALAASKNISIPDSLGGKKRDKFNDLAGKKGKDFDKAYTEFMVEDHKEDIDAFKKEADNGNDAAIKEWAAGKVSILEHHLMMAENARDGKKLMDHSKDSMSMKHD